MTDLENNNRLSFLTNAINIYCEYILLCVKKQNGNFSQVSSGQLGSFKSHAKYKPFYETLSGFVGNNININEVGLTICKVFCEVVNFGFLNTNSFRILDHIIKGDFKIGNFVLNEDLKKNLEEVRAKMLQDFEIPNTIDSDFDEGANHGNFNNVDLIPPTPSSSNNLDTPSSSSSQIPSTHDMINAMDEDQCNENQMINNSTNGNINNVLSALQQIINNQMIIINKTISNNSDIVNTRLDEFAKFLNLNKSSQNYYSKVELLTKSKLKLENQLKLLQSYSDNNRVPPSLAHNHFPRCLLHNSKNSNYFNEYNNAIEICQNELHKINMKELNNMILSLNNEIKDLKKLIASFDENNNEKFQEIDRNLTLQAEKSFSNMNENFNRDIQNPIIKFPIHKPKKDNAKSKSAKKVSNVEKSSDNKYKSNNSSDSSTNSMNRNKNTSKNNYQSSYNSNNSKSNLRSRSKSTSNRKRSKSNNFRSDNNNNTGNYNKSHNNNNKNMNPQRNNNDLNHNSRTKKTRFTNHSNYSSDTPTNFTESNMAQIRNNHNVRSTSTGQVFRSRQNSNNRH
jgi:hypothetical protein